jgi:predicted anti-sigma-YlaC factor YlaD
MMKCHNVQKKLSAYQDRELKPGDQKEIGKHLLSCKSCRTQYEQLERTWEILGGLEETRPAPWFYSQLIIKVKEGRRERVLPAMQHVFQVLKTPTIASILLAFGIVVGSYLGNILVRDFMPVQLSQPIYSQGALLDSLKVFDPAPPGTLAHGYLLMANDQGKEIH